MSGNTNLRLSVGTLDTSGDLLALPLQDDLVARGIGQLVEASTIAAEEVFELLLCNFFLGYGPTLNGFLETKENKLHNIRLSEDTCRGLALLSRGLGLQGVRSTVTSTLKLSGTDREVASKWGEKPPPGWYQLGQETRELLRGCSRL
ncbi:hypothetical protein HG531_010232 [Fusarium graminearum]|nr:hypothetical protein HG531_010232 [Fusarium graminearum]